MYRPNQTNVQTPLTSTKASHKQNLNKVGHKVRCGVVVVGGQAGQCPLQLSTVGAPPPPRARPLTDGVVDIRVLDIRGFHLGVRTFGIRTFGVDFFGQWGFGHSGF